MEEYYLSKIFTLGRMPTELDHAYGSDGDVAVIRRGDIAVLKVKCLHTRDEDLVLAKIRGSVPQTKGDF